MEPSSETISKTQDILQDTSSTQAWIAKALRTFATAAFLIAGYIFLAQGVKELDSVGRALAFTGFLTTLAMLAFVCIRKFRDPKGARVSLGVAGILVPVAYLQLGALLYSTSAGGTYLSTIPDLFIYSAASTASAVGVTLVLGTLLLGITVAGCVVFARPQAKNIAILIGVSNACLLIPTRDEILIFALLLLGSIPLYFAVVKLLNQTKELTTRTQKIATTIPFLPLLLLSARQLSIYQPGALFVGLSLFLIGLLGFCLPKNLGLNQRLILVLQKLSLVALLIGLNTEIAAGLDYLPHTFWLKSYQALLQIGVSGLLLLTLSEFSQSCDKHIRVLGSLVLGIGLLIECSGYHSFWAGLICLCFASLLIAVAYRHQERFPLLTGLTLGLVGMIWYAHYAIKFAYGFSPWVCMGILGVLALLASSYLEQGSRRLVSKVHNLRTLIAKWQ